MRSLSVLVQLSFVYFGADLDRFAVCERCTEIDDHLQNATSEPERKLWLEAKRIHRKYVSMTLWSLNVMHI